MTRLAHSYADEIGPRALERARRRIARRDQAQPVQPEPEERWGPVKIGVVVVFAIAFIYAFVIIAAASQVPA